METIWCSYHKNYTYLDIIRLDGESEFTIISIVVVMVTHGQETFGLIWVDRTNRGLERLWLWRREGRRLRGGKGNWCFLRR